MLFSKFTYFLWITFFHKIREVVIYILCYLSNAYSKKKKRCCSSVVRLFDTRIYKYFPCIYFAKTWMLYFHVQNPGFLLFIVSSNWTWSGGVGWVVRVRSGIHMRPKLTKYRREDTEPESGNPRPTVPVHGIYFIHRILCGIFTLDEAYFHIFYALAFWNLSTVLILGGNMQKFVKC